MLELAHTGVRIVDVRPGDFATNFHQSTRRIGNELADAYAPNLEQAWKAIDKNMARAQNPARVAELLVSIVEGRLQGPVVAVGDVFQARIAPLLARFAPRAWVVWGLRMYYGLKRGA
jgi:NAD(P)-dependent dehydrogenase (short-subunit alcohol dehydrogenase family)